MFYLLLIEWCFFIPFISAVCQQICQNGGKCVAPNTCQCGSGYSGQWCQTCKCLYRDLWDSSMSGYSYTCIASCCRSFLETWQLWIFTRNEKAASAVDRTSKVHVTFPVRKDVCSTSTTLTCFSSIWKSWLSSKRLSAFEDTAIWITPEMFSKFHDASWKEIKHFNWATKLKT